MSDHDDTVGNTYTLWGWLLAHPDGTRHTLLVDEWARNRVGLRDEASIADLPDSTDRPVECDPRQLSLPAYVRQHHPDIWVEWRMSQ